MTRDGPQHAFQNGVVPGDVVAARLGHDDHVRVTVVAVARLR